MRIEGLVAAYKVAKLRNDKRAMESLRSVIERLLVRQIATQVGGPLETHTPPPSAGGQYRPEVIGGILSAATSTSVRIDVVQHQVHAMLMALECFY